MIYNPPANTANRLAVMPKTTPASTNAPSSVEKPQSALQAKPTVNQSIIQAVSVSNQPVPANPPANASIWKPAVVKPVIQSNTVKAASRPVNANQYPTQNRTEPTISPYQFQMLARIISAEAKGEPFQGQVAVGAVILNRIKSERFPKTVAANVLKPGQFEPVANGHIWNEPAPSAVRAARLALAGWDPTNGALYFFNPAKSSSRWIWSRPVITRIGNHVFAA